MDILRISRHPELLPQAAAWFHGKWGIPLSAYEESMEELRFLFDSYNW